MKSLLNSHRIVGLLLVLLMVLAVPAVVLAIGNPDYVTVGDAYVFRNVSTTGDQLFFVRYDVSYNSVPSEDAEDTWEMALYNSTGSLIATRSLNYYQHNIISIYLTEDDAVTWQGAHQVVIRGMPSVFGNLTEGINQRTRTLAPGDYYENDYLGGIMLTQAEILEDDWAITLLSSTDRLNDTGKTFFLAAIPGLGDMAPEIFDVITGSVDTDYTDYNHTYSETLKTNQGDKLEDAIGEVGKMFGVYSTDWTTFWLVMIFFMMVAGAAFSGFGNPGWGIVGGYAALAGCGYLFGGSIWTLAIIVGAVITVIFGIIFLIRMLG